MKYLFIKYKKTLYWYIYYELLRLQYKYIYFNSLLPSFLRAYAFFNMNVLGHKSSLVKIRQMCLFSGKVRSIYKLVHLNFFELKIQQYQSNIIGLYKASW